MSARPRLTHYDGIERIELSGRVLVNWVSKAANLLREEFDAEPGTRVVLDLPAGHWRAAYWALACWAVGATILVEDEPDAGPSTADLVVTQQPRPAGGPPQVVVTLAALARRHPAPLPSGAFDEAAVLSTYGDVFDEVEDADPSDPALVDEAGALTFAELVGQGGPVATGTPARSLLADPQSPGTALRTMLATWAAGGSIVVTHAIGGEDLARLAEAEGVTTRL